MAGGIHYEAPACRFAWVLGPLARVIPSGYYHVDQAAEPCTAMWGSGVKIGLTHITADRPTRVQSQARSEYSAADFGPMVGPAAVRRNAAATSRRFVTTVAVSGSCLPQIGEQRLTVQEASVCWRCSVVSHLPIKGVRGGATQGLRPLATSPECGGPCAYCIPKVIVSSAEKRESFTPSAQWSTFRRAHLDRLPAIFHPKRSNGFLVLDPK